MEIIGYFKRVGFTLAELLIVITLVTILTTIAIPSLRFCYHKILLKSHINSLISALELIRIEAIVHQRLLYFCGSLGQQCDGYWSHYWLLWSPSQEKIIKKRAVAWSHYHLILKSSLGKRDYVMFDEQGFTHGQQGSFYFCPQYRHGIGARVVITRTGRIRIDYQHRSWQSICPPLR